MLAVTSYTQEYVDETRARFAAHVAAYDALGDAVAPLEPAFFTTLVLALDHCFVHRVRKQEGKQLKAVRALCTAIENAGGEVTRDEFRALADGFFAEIEARYPH